MIKIDTTDRINLVVDGEFFEIVNECSAIVDYCACYYVNNEFNRGVPIEVSKQKLKTFLLKAVDAIVDDTEILPEGNSLYTS